MPTLGHFIAHAKRYGFRKRLSHARSVTGSVYDDHSGAHMRIFSVRDFRDRATQLLRSKDPVLVTRRGRLAGIFFPAPELTLPIELKRELFPILGAEIRRQLRRRCLSERDVEADFASWRKTRRPSTRLARC